MMNRLPYGILCICFMVFVSYVPLERKTNNDSKRSQNHDSARELKSGSTVGLKDSLISTYCLCKSEWGFFAHRLINRLAVFTLPSQMIEFYKKHLEYISSHAVDPDKRRYASKGEAIRHYIDLDHWLASGKDSLPLEYAEAWRLHARLILRKRDSCLLYIALNPSTVQDGLSVQIISSDSCMYATATLCWSDVRALFYRDFLSEYDPENWSVNASVLKPWFANIVDGDHLVIEDSFSAHGILPYHLIKAYHQLIDAFRQQNANRILRLSSELGHYLGDAHVPLHTTKNYNGQLTNQYGIHAFWESRIPELFAEEEFDFIVGRASFITDIRTFIWNVVKDSHACVLKVLEEEKRLAAESAQSSQYCFEERYGVIAKLACPDFARAYHERLDGQVEERMRACILNLGSMWMSAWIEAGQPDLDVLQTESKNVTESDADTTIIPYLRNHIRPHE